jgi:hypothetical protein
LTREHPARLTRARRPAGTPVSSARDRRRDEPPASASRAQTPPRFNSNEATEPAGTPSPGHAKLLDRRMTHRNGNSGARPGGSERTALAQSEPYLRGFTGPVITRQRPDGRDGGRRHAGPRLLYDPAMTLHRAGLPRRRAADSRLLRWTPGTYLQAWLLAAVISLVVLSTYLIVGWAAAWNGWPWPDFGLALAAVTLLSQGVTQSYGLRRRRRPPSTAPR